MRVRDITAAHVTLELTPEELHVCIFALELIRTDSKYIDIAEQLSAEMQAAEEVQQRAQQRSQQR